MRWFKHLFSRQPRYDELSACIREHLAEKIDALMEGGMSREDAERNARREFGNVTLIEERSREVWQWPKLESFWADLKLSFYQFRRAPVFTLTALAALALGIGTTTAVFSVVNTVILKPLTYPKPDRLVLFFESSPRGGTFPVASFPEFHFWQQQSNLFQDVSATNTDAIGMNLTGEQPKLVHGINVSSGYFGLYGARILLGHAFTAQEENPCGGKTVVLGYYLWKNSFAGDPNIIGRSITLGGEPYTVIGVVAQEFHTDSLIDLWLPLRVDPASSDPTPFYRIVGRLKSDVTLDQANIQLKAAADRFREKYPGAIPPDRYFLVRPLGDSIIGNARFPLLLFLGAVGLVLLIACANVANLQLIRASGREREFAIRTSLGASGSRIVRQLLTESLLLSLTAGVLGIALGELGVHLLLKVSSGDIPRIGVGGSAVRLDWRVFVFGLCLSLLTGVLFGLAPALSASRLDLSTALKESGRAAGPGIRQRRARSVLVVIEAALAVMLSIGAALFVRTLVALYSVDPGFSPQNILTMQMALTGPRFQATAPVTQLINNARERIDALPGVLASAVTMSLPLQGAHRLPFDVVGRTAGSDPNTGLVAYEAASPGFLSVFQIPLLHGRDFRPDDNAAAPPIVLINQAMAGQFWPKQNPIGQQIVLGKGMPPMFADKPREIVGIVGDVLVDGLQSAAQPMAIIPQAQTPDAITALTNHMDSIHWVFRTKVDPHQLIPAITDQLRQATGGLPTSETLTMREIVSTTTARQDFNAQLLSAFAAFALILAAIGLYGLMAYSVQQRSQEIGVRMALGANQARIRNMVIWQGMRLALIGILIGWAVSLPLSRFLNSLLFGVKSWDPTIFVIVPSVLVCVALFSVWVPARRGARLDPMQSLRME
jgi:putative ABC transport system permease protein